MKTAKNCFKKEFFKLTNNSIFGKITEKVRKHRDATLATKKEKKLFGVRTELLYCKVFHRKFLGDRNEKNSNTYE